MYILIDAKEMELFKNITEFQFGQTYYDLHNDFTCTRISFTNKSMEIFLKHGTINESICLRFLDTEIIKLNFNCNFLNEGLTMDNLYRGRFEVEGNLYEFSNDQRSYYYLEFYEGQTIEFFCRNIELVEHKD